ncbi:MAG: class I SAM-dependent methyltransferase [Gammaproteobacteria bacterium]|jgi:16S rRNA (guanine1207-N2)-methyltransferase|nr:class I SAM-dependent methyltransferase [Gammaproteobacteria bacterium]MCP4882045.1 class I SAM-dependent methyltransferase [Gammaproteobacteria bacterium]MDP6165750.1 class I SAM-dependent methyltransferase [Gammaproteobacteria bacterium]
MILETHLKLPQGSLHLQRVPLRRNELLQAWDSADQLVLETLPQLTSASRVLVINDSFGALSCGILQQSQEANVTVWGDSYLGYQALRHNGRLNNLPDIAFVDSLATPQGPFDKVIMRLPKSNSLLRDQVARLLPQLAPDAQVIIPIMIKHLDTRLYELLTQLLGSLSSSRAKKKARLLLVHVEQAADNSPEPTVNSWSCRDMQLSHYSGVYGRKRLDEGTQFLLDNWPQGVFKRVVDVGCGNGILSLQAAKSWPTAMVTGVDESYMAVASATLNARQNGVQQQCQFQVGNCAADLVDQSADLVLCNPPFHQQRVVGDHLAMAMFADAARVLTVSGELWVVGNRHLGYHAKLKRWFKRVDQQGKHAKFVVLRCRK